MGCLLMAVHFLRCHQQISTSRKQSAEGLGTGNETRLSSCNHQPIQPCYAVLILLSEPQQTEVLCSVQFAPVQQLTLEFGRLWETLSRDPALAACQLVQFYNIGISGITPRPAKVSCSARVGGLACCSARYRFTEFAADAERDIDISVSSDHLGSYESCPDCFCSVISSLKSK